MSAIPSQYHIPIPLSCSNVFNAKNFTGDFNSSVEQSRSLAAESLVGICPQVCPLLYGNGNPDISGIGVLIAYLLQSSYLILFGAILSTFVLFLPKHRTNSLHLIRIRAISRAVMGTSTLLTFTSLIATQVRARQYPPPYEVIFLRELKSYLNATTQFSLAAHFILWLRSIKIENRDRFVLLSDLVNRLLAKLTVPAMSDGKSGNLALSAILDACSTLKGFPAPIKDLDSPRSMGRGWKLICVVTILLTLVAGYLYWSYEEILRRKFAELKLLQVTGSALLTFYFISLNISNMANLVMHVLYMVQTRRRLLVVNQAANDENQWAFGQVTVCLFVMGWNSLE